MHFGGSLDFLYCTQYMQTWNYTNHLHNISLIYTSNACKLAYYSLSEYKGGGGDCSVVFKLNSLFPVRIKVTTSRCVFSPISLMRAIYVSLRYLVVTRIEQICQVQYFDCRYVKFHLRTGKITKPFQCVDIV